MTRPLLMLLLALLGSLVAADYQVVTQFASDGQLPMARLVYEPVSGKFFGTTSAGGTNDCGTVFSLTPEGVRTTLLSFSGVAGPAKGEAPDAGLVLGPDGLLYGVTAAGGAGDFGTIFRISTTGVFTNLVEFTGSSGAAKGAVPNELVLASDGSFYGTTQAGGANEHGTVFRLNLPSASITTLIELTGPGGGGASVPRGSAPVGALVASGSNLYGVTAFGGTSDFGLVFRITTAGVWTTLAQFTGISGGIRGAYPAAGLVLHSDGALYGTTEFGGTEDFGTVFRITVGGTFTHMHAFNDLNGSSPAGALVMGADQTLYGTTSAGGANGFGTIFRIETTSPYNVSVLHSFTGEVGVLPGDAPRAGLTLGPGGSWYGTTSAGGAGNYGTVFTLTPLFDASNVAVLGNDGSWRPGGGVTFVSAGTFLLPLSEGGAAGGGSLANVTGGSASIEANFGSPFGTPAVGSLAKIGADYYGVTRSGGANNRGTFYRFSPGSGITTLADLSADVGASPEGPLTLGSDGHLYGVATEGGTANRGAILRYETNGTITNLGSFTGTAGAVPGRLPHAPLVRADDGSFYGVTEFGGADNRGSVFRVGLDGNLTTIHQFGATGPGRPLAGLSSAGNGILLGTAGSGGPSNEGTIFQITTGGVLTNLLDFTGANGSQPNSQLLKAVDGTFYGTTFAGGSQSLGTVFTYRPNTGLQTLVHFFGSSGLAPGDSPVGELTFGPDGMIYGAAESGGSQGGGLVYRISGFGPHVVTDPPRFALSVPSLRGRMQTGGQVVTARFEYGFDATLPFPNSVPPSSSVTENGAVNFALPLIGLTVGQTVFYRAVATGPTSTSIGEIRSFVIPSPLAGWKLNELGSSSAEDLGDPDWDGLANLVEYALMKSPTVPDPSGPTAGLGNVPGDPRLTLTFERDPARNDVTISVQASSAVIGPWETITSSVNGAPFSGPATVVGDGPGTAPRTVQVRDLFPIQQFGQRYLKIIVSH